MKVVFSAGRACGLNLVSLTKRVAQLVKLSRFRPGLGADLGLRGPIAGLCCEQVLLEFSHDELQEWSSATHKAVL